MKVCRSRSPNYWVAVLGSFSGEAAGRNRDVELLSFREPRIETELSRFAQGMGSVTPETAFKALDADQARHGRNFAGAGP